MSETPTPAIASTRSAAVTSAAWANFGMGAVYVLFGGAMLMLSMTMFQDAGKPSETQSPAGWWQAVPPLCCLEFLGPFAKALEAVIGLIVGACGTGMFLLSLPFFLAGYGMLDCRRWSRYLTLTLASVSALLALQCLVGLILPARPHAGPTMKTEIVMPDAAGKPVPVMEFDPSREPPQKNYVFLISLLFPHATYSTVVLAILLNKDYAREFERPPAAS